MLRVPVTPNVASSMKHDPHKTLVSGSGNMSRNRALCMVLPTEGNHHFDIRSISGAVANKSPSQDYAPAISGLGAWVVDTCGGRSDI